MEFLKRLSSYASSRGDCIAFQNAFFTEDHITYKELDNFSNAIANLIFETLPNDKSPIIVYGHKSSLMIASFIGCVKANHPYCPIDISLPDERVKDIIELSHSQLMIETVHTNVNIAHKVSIEELVQLSSVNSPTEMKKGNMTTGGDVFYIIFTSGSTGKPKGVQITADSLDNFLAWMVTLGRDNELSHPNVFLNQAPFSFDLSVMDVYTSLYTGGTIWALDKRLQEDMESMYLKMKISGINVWVSTPSFINMCLINRDFNFRMLPNLHTILFCGEVLTNRTAEELHKRFPNATVVNTYGPTESTVAVTDVIITEEMTGANMPLSIGKPKPGSPIYILGKDYQLPAMPDGEKGEIVICGDTVAKGYLNQPSLSSEKFFNLATTNGLLRAYKTGDEGYYQNGLLYYCGRIDFQLKIDGYRIELGDIENNIIKLENILYCIVLPIVKNGENKGLAAFVTTKNKIEEEFEYSQKIRKDLMKYLPKYMIPKKFFFIEKMPMTNNGKVNRKSLEQMLIGEGMQ